MAIPAPQRILIVRPSALGDVCRTVPVLASLRAAFPNAVIDWVVQDDFAPAIAAHPALNEIITFPRSRFAHWWRSRKRISELRQWFGQIRRRRYDLVLDCQGLGRSGLITRASRARMRVGLRSAREFAWLAYNVRVPRRASQPLPVHTVDQMLMLLEAVAVEPVRDMRLFVTEADARWWRGHRESIGLQQRPYAVIAPTSRWLSKRWPADRFADLIEPLRQRGFGKVLVIGSPSEAEQVQELFWRFRPGSVEGAEAGPERRFVLDLVGKTNLGQTMAVIAGAGLVVANDSAPLHMAVGFDRPCVALFGPTDPAVVGPYQRAEAVVRGYVPSRHETVNFKDPRLGDRLMRLISTATVIERIDYVLSASSRPKAGAATASGKPARDILKEAAS